MLYTRGKNSPGWENIDLIDPGKYPCLQDIPTTIVDDNINKHIVQMQNLQPDYIWSLGWQQLFKQQLLDICPVLGFHESLLPEGAGAAPIANAILHERPKTGVTLFKLTSGIDSGPIIGQLAGNLDPRIATSTQLYQEAMLLEKKLIIQYVPLLNQGILNTIQQDFSKRTVYSKIIWQHWSADKVKRARTYPYN